MLNLSINREEKRVTAEVAIKGTMAEITTDFCIALGAAYDQFGKDDGKDMAEAFRLTVVHFLLSDTLEELSKNAVTIKVQDLNPDAAEE